MKKTVVGVTKMADKSIKSTPHHGRNAETDEVENEVVDWILMNRSLAISVSSWELIIKACSKTILSNSKTLKTYKK